MMVVKSQKQPRLEFLFFFCLLFISCHHQDKISLKQIQSKVLLCCDTARRLIYSGDIITRTGNDFTSTCLKKLNKKDPTYSHIGIASIESGKIYIYHAVGGESNPNEKIRRDPLSFFVNGYDNSGFGIFRFHLPPKKINDIVDQAQHLYIKGILFDLDFDMDTDDKMYCSEYVAKTIEKVVNIPHYFKLDTLSGKVYIAPDAIFLHRDCQEVKRLRYF